MGNPSLVVFLILTHRQVSYWRNDLSLFGHAIEVTEDNCTMHDNYAIALLKDNRVDEALQHLEKALHINPKYTQARKRLGNVYLDQGKYDFAVNCFEKALQDGTDNPQDVYNNLGVAYFRQGKYDLAIQNYNQALLLDPNHIRARRNLLLVVKKLKATKAQ